MRTSLLAVVVLLMAAALYAQTGGAPGSGAMGAPFGNGVQSTPAYSGTTGPSNVLLLSLNSVTSYDNNILGISQSQQLGDALLGLGPRLALFQQRGPVGIEIDYQPYFQFYQHLTRYDRVNQALAANVTYTLGSHFSVRVRDSFTDQTGAYQTESSQPLVPGLGAPTALNNNIYTPLTAQRDNNSRLDLIYTASSRTSVSFFGGYDQRTMSDQPSGVQSLFDTRSFSSGLQYTYRLSSHATLGMLYGFQVYEYQGALPAGTAPRLVAYSSILSLGWRATPSVSLQVFGGPEYLPAQHAADQASVPALPNISSMARWSWTAGGALSKASEKTSLQLSAGHAVTDGGGLLGTVTNTYASVGVNRKLIRRWSASCNVMGSESRGLNYGSSGGKLDSLNGTVGLDHPLTENLNTRLSYTLTRQYASGSVPFGSDLSHGIVSLTISYQLRKIPLGR